MNPKNKTLLIRELWLKLKNFFVGIITGLSDIVPGFSGGTLINITGYISKIIDGWKHFVSFRIHTLKWWLNFAFGAVFVFGWAIGFLFISRYIAFFLDGEFKENRFWSHFTDIPVSITWFFAAFVLGSVFTFNKIEKIKILKFDNPTNKFNWKEFFSKKNLVSFSLIVAGFTSLITIGLIIVFHKHGLPDQAKHHNSNFTQISTENYFKLLVAGFLSSFSLLLPGISGSMILLLLGIWSLFFGHITKHPLDYLGGIVVYGAAAVLSVALILTFLEKISPANSRLLRIFSLGMLGASWIVILLVYKGSLLPSTALSWGLTIIFISIGFLFNYLIYKYFKMIQKGKHRAIKLK